MIATGSFTITNLNESTIHDAYFEHGKNYYSANYEGKTVPEITKGTIVTGTGQIGGNVYEVSGAVWVYYRYAIPVDVNKVYRVTFRVKQTVDSSTSGTSKVYAGVATLDSNYINLTGGAGTHRYCAVSGINITVADGWKEYVGIISGVGDTHNTFRAGTAYVRPMFIVNYSGGTGTAQVDAIDFKDVTEEYNAKDSSVPIGTKFDESIMIGNGHGIKIQDNLNNLRVHMGQYEAGKYGLLLKNKTGTSTVLDEDGILQTDTVQEADNVDELNPLQLKFYIDEAVLKLEKVKLHFSLEKFRAYSKSAGSGGSYSSTSSDGGGTTISTTNTDYVFQSGFTGDSVYSAGSHDHGGSAAAHNHGLSNAVNTAPTITSDGDHSHATYNHGHSVTMDIPSHSHSVYIPSHTHNLIYGIFAGTAATGVTIKVNGVLIDNTGYTTDQGNIDITSALTTTGKLCSDTQEQSVPYHTVTDTLFTSAI